MTEFKMFNIFPRYSLYKQMLSIVSLLLQRLIISIHSSACHVTLKNGPNDKTLISPKLKPSSYQDSTQVYDKPEGILGHLKYI